MLVKLKTGNVVPSIVSVPMTVGLYVPSKLTKPGRAFAKTPKPFQRLPALRPN